MDDSFEQPKFDSTPEHDVTERMAIDRLIRIQHLPAECFHDRAPRRFSWSDHLSCECIGIDYDRAAPPEHVRDRGLARGNPPRQSNKNHGVGA
jgi:hypothetical protein